MTPDVDAAAGIALQVAINIGPAQRIGFVIIKDHVRWMRLAGPVPLVFTGSVLIPRPRAAPEEPGKKVIGDDLGQTGDIVGFGHSYSPGNHLREAPAWHPGLYLIARCKMKRVG